MFVAAYPHPPRCARHPLPQCGRGAATHSAKSSSPAPRERGDQAPTGPRGARPEDRLRAWWVRVVPRSSELRSFSREELIGLERALNLTHVAGRQQGEHQQYAGLLRGEVLAGDDAALAQPSTGGDTAGRTAALHNEDPGFG